MAEFYDVLRLPPNADDSEAAVIAAILSTQGQLDLVVEEGLRPDDFRQELFRKVLQAALRLHQRGVEQVDFALIAQEPDSGVSEDDADSLVTLLDRPPLMGDLAAHRQQIIEASRRRSMTYALRDGLRMLGESKPADEVHSVVGTELDRVFDSAGFGPEPIGDVLLRLTDRPDDVERRLSSGFGILDATLGGLKPGNLIVLAARPGHGKTALASSFGLNVAKAGEGVLFVSLEMTSEDVALRLLSLHSGVAHKRIAENRLDGTEADQVAIAQNELERLPLRILDRAPLRVSDIATAVRLAKRRHGLKLLIVDYLQLLEPTDRKVIREQQVADQSRTLKMLAKSAEIPILCLAQLNRSIESRGNKQPRLSDLRESGAIEQDADSVLFLHLQHKSDPTADPRAATLSVAKNRHGQTDEIDLEWIAHRMEYREASL